MPDCSFYFGHYQTFSNCGMMRNRHSPPTHVRGYQSNHTGDIRVPNVSQARKRIFRGFCGVPDSVISWRPFLRSRENLPPEGKTPATSNNTKGLGTLTSNVYKRPSHSFPHRLQSIQSKGHSIYTWTVRVEFTDKDYWHNECSGPCLSPAAD